ncbi:MAG: restriction endonuclease [Clostridia bacterium]|nr:restriction endonuclease [Clostridia bacterium]
MILPKDLEEKIYKATNFFWNTRTNQIKKQASLNNHDQGNRGAVTGGKQLDGFVDLIKEILILNGVEEQYIHTTSDVELPGYYRPNKKWDLLIVRDNILIAAIEFKSQVGPSFGNNFNNRTEEAMGSALDIWTAYREGVFGTQKAPWLGYFLVLEDCLKSTVPVKVRSPHFSVMNEFVNASYKQRYELFCNKLLLERQYTSACFLTTGLKEKSNISINYPNENLSFKAFVSSLIGHIISFAPTMEE